MQPLEVSEGELICRFIEQGEWDEDLEQPTPHAFLASDRELSMFHPGEVAKLGDDLRDLCFGRLEGAGEAHLQVVNCIKLAEDISPVFRPKVYWRPDKVHPAWQRWAQAHVQIESKQGNKSFPITYRSLLAEHACCLRPPDPA